LIVVVVLVVLVIAFLGALVWITTRDAAQPTRGLLMLSALTLFLTLPSLALAVGAAT
jgi:flavin reductase (DIM6/NTAB) family NADH-FMN oxidoreductase RutF